LEHERDLVLEEMRGFLEGVQTITQGLAKNDMKSIAEAAKKIGMVNAGGFPVSLMAKLPLEFKTLGMATHKAFDALSMEAQDLSETKAVLAKMAELMNNCTTCHSTYRIDSESGKK
jgi:cytochrome c556